MATEKRIDIGDLTEVVTASVQRAIQERTPAAEPLGRFIIGIIIEPPYGGYYGTTGKGGETKT